MKKKNSFPEKKNSLLLFENGDFFFGKGIGSYGIAMGEVCFNTSITGYQEILTDPSYLNQIINFTFPHVGITGINKEDYESDKIFASGCIFNNNVTKPSNYRSEISIDRWLKKNKKVGISQIDTRTITRRIRDNGYCNVLINYPKNGNLSIEKLHKQLKNFPSIANQDLAIEASTDYIYEWNNFRKEKISNISELEKKKIIAVFDFGVKFNILNLLKSIGYKVIVFPANFNIEKIFNLHPVGFFLSNGPGDPLATYKKIKRNMDLLIKNNIPTFGICLGHQILGLCYNAKTKKMHHGHRGANHPIKSIDKKFIEITVQNHGFVISNDKFPNQLRITHKSLFDDTIAGLRVKNKPFFSVQYHPEASPGPHDSRYLFDEFKKEILKYAKKKRY